MTQLWELSATDMIRGYSRRDFSPVEVLEACRGRIAQVNPLINAHWHVAGESADDAARLSTQRWLDGRARPLEGVPVGIKDVIDVAGMPCTGGSRIFRERVATEDAPAVYAIRESGAVILTKDATTEFAVGGPHNPAFGPTRNPWALDHWSGGSSSGAGAGVAAGCVPLALGSDGGGSIRIPSSWSGCTGIKPTIGRVSTRGHMALSWTLATVGPIARNAGDAARFLQVIEGFDPGDAQSISMAPIVVSDTEPLDLTGLTIGRPRDWYEGRVTESVRQALDEAAERLAGLGARVVDVPGPSIDADFISRVSYHVLFAEAAFALGQNRLRVDEMDPVTVRRTDPGLAVSSSDYLLGLRFRYALQRELLRMMEGVDMLLVPTTPSTAPRLDDLTVLVNGERRPIHQGQSLWTVPFNLSGFPGLAMRAGFEGDLPVSIQVVGRPLSESNLIQAAVAYQEAMSDRSLFPTFENESPRPMRVAANAAPIDERASLDAQVVNAASNVWTREPLSAARLEDLTTAREIQEADFAELQADQGDYLREFYDPSAATELVRSFARKRGASRTSITGPAAASIAAT